MKLRFLSCLIAVASVHTPSFAQPGMPQPLPAEALVDTADAEKARWLTRHIVADGPVSGAIKFNFPSDFYRNRLILLGESHGVAAPQLLDFELLKHLNAKIGLRDYLAEVDPVQAFYLNRYLETGDDAQLSRIFSFWTQNGSQWANQAFRDKVVAIKALNKRLPANRQIRFVGIDAMQDWPLAAELISNGDAAASAKLSATAREDRAAAYLVALGARNDALADLLRGTLQDSVDKKDRETIIFENYRRAVSGPVLGDRPAYGLWGLFHILQSGVNRSMPFAARVGSSDLPAAKSTATIALLSLDSAIQMPIPTPQGIQRIRLTQFNVDGPFIMTKGAATLRAASNPNKITIFQTGTARSPIGANEFLTFTTSVGQNLIPDQTDKDAQRLAQYIGVVRNSDWAPPLK